jgi:adenosylcobalamin-dependent ribonucleoside-triphosphate reductase
MFAKYGLNGFWSEEHFERHEKLRTMMVEQNIPIPAWFDELGVKHYDQSVNGDKPYNFGRPLHHRRMSNNSIAFTEQPTRERLNFVFEMMQLEGEPGFVNLRELAIRRFKGAGQTEYTEEMLRDLMEEIGMNPCAEIDLLAKGVCNLTTVNATAFVRDGEIDLDGIFEAQHLSARAGLRMTLVDLELSEAWRDRQNTDRLTGTSLTGWKDAMAMVNASAGQEALLLHRLGEAAREETDKYAKHLRVVSPLLVTTVKPEGTISQLMGGVSSGLHWSHSPFYIRRIRINAADPLAKAVQALGWTVNPEVGTAGATHEERMANARTYVIDFPVASGATRTKDDVPAAEQLETYFRFQTYYTEHNSSNTITIRSASEWTDAENIVWDQWDQFTAVSFLALDGGTYQLAPYEACDEATYEALKARMIPFDPSILQMYETGALSDLDGADGCEGGACPVR